MKRLGGVALVVTALLLAGCSMPEPTPTANATTGAPTSVAALPTSAPTPSPTEINRTYEAQAAGGAIISKAVESEDGTLTIYTDVANSRSDVQEVARYEAQIACEAVRASLGVESVRVLDAGDRAFVVLGGQYADCTIL
ncbi:hypothetical protein [Microbacterium arborescens]